MTSTEQPWAMPANADLETRFNRLVIIQRAAWALQKEQTGVTDQQLLDRVAAMDAADGNVDGRHTPRTKCGSCGAVTKAGAQCAFCGAVAGSVDPFSGL